MPLTVFQIVMAVPIHMNAVMVVIMDIWTANDSAYHSTNNGAGWPCND